MANRLKPKFVARVGELDHGQSKKFTLQRGDRKFEAMLVNYQGKLFAYMNRCPHIGITLDWLDNQFFSVDGRYLVCANHGAVFEPPTGECIWGPCSGAALQTVSLIIEGQKVFAITPGSTREARAEKELGDRETRSHSTRRQRNRRKGDKEN